MRNNDWHENTPKPDGFGVSLFVIDVASMSDVKGNDDQFFIAYFAEETVVSDAVTPVPFVVAGERFAGVSRVPGLIQQMGLDPPFDSFLDGWVEFFEPAVKRFCGQ